MTDINGSHHVTLSVGHALEAVDCHSKVLGMRTIKKTVLYDGNIPVYHLYYSNTSGEPSSVITTFPWAQHGLYGTRGTNQAREVLLSVPQGSLDFWTKRLAEYDIEAQSEDVFGTRRLNFAHPSGVEYVFVENEHDTRVGHTGHGVPQEAAVHGIHGVGIHVYDQDRMVEFGKEAFYAKGEIEEEGDRVRFQVGDDSIGNWVELTGNRTEQQGTWRYGAGQYHHFAWNMGSLENQEQIKIDIEGAGYTDISELKDRTYF